MLIKRVVLDRIVSGEIDMVFRKWRKPTVKSGGTINTSVGVLAIDEVEPMAASRITKADADRAGYASKAELVRELASRTEGQIYRIVLRHVGADPRIALRENNNLSDDDLVELNARLARLDKSSKRGDWTTTFLRLLDANPKVRAEDLALGLGLDKPTLKNDVRKLKTLGLTISHSPGYELSPRGKAYLATL